MKRLIDHSNRDQHDLQIATRNQTELQITVTVGFYFYTLLCLFFPFFFNHCNTERYSQLLPYPASLEVTVLLHQALHNRHAEEQHMT